MKIGMVSLGCPKNLVYSEVMLGLAQQEGHRLTRDAADAEVLVVNTCAFIDKAKQESIDTILEMAEHKKTGACQRLIVTGCLAERYRDELRAQIPEIDAIIGTGEVPKIVDAIGGGSGLIQVLRSNGEPVIPGGSERTRPTLPDYLYDANTPRLLATPRHYAYVKIAEGCDYKCAFCIIPKMRGHYRSRPIESIVQEARQLAAQGVKELLLVSQDTTGYGTDLPGGRRELLRLLAALDRIPGVVWIRLLYTYPALWTTELMDAMASLEHVAPYVDVPIQHVSERMLRRMNRGIAAERQARFLAELRRRVPGVAVRTTVIVATPPPSPDEKADAANWTRPGRSLSRMTSWAEPGAATPAPPVGLRSTSRIASSPSTAKSSRIGTVNVLLTSPGPKVSVPATGL